MQLLTAGSEAEFLAALVRAAGELGFEYCSYRMRTSLPLSNPKLVWLNNYSEDWQQRYVEENYFLIDPTVAHGLKSVMPLVWSEQLFHQCPRFRDEASEHGLRFGWSQAFYDAKGVGGLLTLARSKVPLSELELKENSLKMSWLGQVAHQGLSRLILGERAPDGQIMLTNREAEVLRWSADGKTASEVGEIMNIAERTVNFHVNNALEKLGACNKTAGVIKAAMLRLL